MVEGGQTCWWTNILEFTCKNANPSLELVQILIDIGGKKIVTSLTLREACACAFRWDDNPSSLEVIRLLIETGGKCIMVNSLLLLDICSYDGNSNASLEVVRLLIEIGGLNILTSSVLDAACSWGKPSLEIIKLLIDAGGKNVVTSYALKKV
jgi:hypothetical protein